MAGLSLKDLLQCDGGETEAGRGVMDRWEHGVMVDQAQKGAQSAKETFTILNPFLGP